MITVLLIIHGLLAVALLGAITHQAASVWWALRKPAGNFVERFRSVSAPSYASAVVFLFIAAFILGGIIYPDYRLGVRVVLEENEMWLANGSFELKEHLAVIGLAILPAYWCFWRTPLAAEHGRVRAALTAMLAFIVWWNFLTGHVLNNIRGFGS